MELQRIGRTPASSSKSKKYFHGETEWTHEGPVQEELVEDFDNIVQKSNRDNNFALYWQCAATRGQTIHHRPSWTHKNLQRGIATVKNLAARPVEVGPIRVSEPPDACRLRRGQVYETHDVVMMALNSYAVYTGELERRLTAPRCGHAAWRGTTSLALSNYVCDSATE
eukprot:5534521-Pleurochrysis_carterae.AAC.1